MIDDGQLEGLLLDAGAVAAIIRDNPDVHRWLRRAATLAVPVRVAAVTLAEVPRHGEHAERTRWVLARLAAAPVTERHAAVAARLIAAGDGQLGTVPALVAATALGMRGRVVVLTTDPAPLRTALRGHRRVRTAMVGTGPVGTGPAGTGPAGTGQAGTGQAGTDPAGTGLAGTGPVGTGPSTG